MACLAVMSKDCLVKSKNMNAMNTVRCKKMGTYNEDRHGAQAVAAVRDTSGLARAFILFVSFAGMMLGATNANAVACSAIATGNWNAQTTWGAAGTGCVGATGGIPGAADTVTVPTTRVVTVTAAAAATSLTVTSTGSLVNNSTLTVSTTLAGTGILTNSATGILNIGGTSTITTLTATAAGNIVNYTGAAAQTVKATTYDTLNTSGAGVKSVAGIVTVNTALTGTALTNAAAGRLSIGGTSTITTLTATAAGNIVTYTGAGQTIKAASYATLNITGSATNSGTVTVATALGGVGTLTNAATGRLNIGGTSLITTLDAATAGNIVTYTGAAAQTIKATTYATLTTSGAGVKTITGIVTVNTALTGTTLTNGATGTLNIGGTSTITTLTSTAVGNIVNYTGAAQTIKATSYATLNVNGTASNAGTVTVATALGGTGTLTNGAAASILNIGGTSTIAGLTATFVGNTVNYTGAAAQTIYPTAYNKLGTSGAGAKTIAAAPAAAVTVGGTLVVTGGALTNNNTLTVTGVLSGAGTLVNATAASVLNLASTPTITGLTATFAGNTVNYTGAAQTVKATTYSNLGLMGTGVKTMPATFQINGTTTVGSTIGLGANGTKVFVGLVTINAGGVWNNAVNRAVSFRGGLTHNGATFTAGTGVYTFNTTAAQAINCTAPSTMTIPSLTVTTPTVLTNNCNLTVSTALAGTGNFTNGASGTLNYSLAAVPAITTFVANTAGNTVNYTGAAQTVRQVAYSNLGLGGSGVKTLTGVGTVGGNFTLYGAAGTSASVVTPLTVGGNLSIAAGNTLANGANAISLAGNFTQNGTFTAGAGVFTLTGTTPHVISGTGTLGFNNLTVSNSGAITLARNVTVTSAILGTFTLTSVCPDYTLTSNGGLTVQHTCSSLISAINLGVASPTSATTVSWTVVFSQSVTGVDASAFGLVASGVTGASITSVTGSGTNWTVTANTGSGSGTLGLNQTGPGLVVPTLSGTYTGPVYTIAKDTCFIDNFNRADGAPAGNWVVANEGGAFGNPTIVGNRLRLTDASTGVSTMAALQQLFPAAGNKIVVEFDHFAYNGSGADGIAVVLSDASVAPLPGAFGGSLGYAPKQVSAGGDTTHPGFAGGWIGLAIDEYGNFSANTEGRTGGTAPGLTIDSVAIRGSGSGYTGYPYHKGTVTLTPGVDLAGATPAPGHRYRIIIDHTNGTNAWTSVERDTTGLGTSYATLIPAYDAKVETGQAAVPTNWYLSFTGSTGASTNIHEVDNLSICTVQPQPVPTLHHIRILHDGAALSCAAETVTVKACADANCTALYLGSVTVNVSSTGGTWSANPVTFTGGQTSIRLAKATAGTVTLGTTSTTPVAASATRCFNGATETCSLTYTLSTACFDAVEKGGAAGANIYTKLSGTAFSLDVLATNSGAVNSSYTGTIAMDLVDPTAASGNCGDTNTGLTNAVNYTFTAVDAGRRTFNFNYPSAAANVQVRIRDTSVVPNQPSCSTDKFVVRPVSLVLTATGLGADATGVSASATPVVNAGTAFTLTATASDTGYTGTPTIDLAKLVAHAGAVRNGTLAGAFGAAVAGVASGAAFTYDDAGYFKFNANGLLDATFTAVDSAGSDCTADFSTTLVGGKYGCKIGSAATIYFGRFIPDHFDTVVSGGMTCPAGLLALTPTCPATGFIYADQPFATTVKAMNAADALTQNYAGIFAKAVTLSAVDAVSAAIAVGGIVNGNVVATAFGAGQATVLAAAASPISFHFTATPTAPTNMHVKAVDGEVSSSVATPISHPVEGGFKVVSGRVKLSNAHGSELLKLPMFAIVQYYSGAAWVQSMTDSVTSLTLAATYNVVKSGVTTGTTTPTPTGVATVSGGNLNIQLSKPTGGAGSATVNPVAPGYLPVTAGLATFGVYKGNNEFIYLRESY